MEKLKNNPQLRRVLGTVVLPLLVLGIGAVLTLYYILGPAEGYMTSDCTDSLRWAQATFESGRLISDNFYYAAILPFGGNIIFLPFIAIFDYSMTAQLCGLALFALLFIAALYYLATGLGYSRLTSAAMVSITLMIMSSSAKLREIMWEHIFYYNLGLLFFCFGFGLALRILRGDGPADDPGAARPHDWVRVGILAVFSLIAATDGLQTLVCFTLPLLCGIFVDRFFNEDRLLCRRNVNTALLLLLVLVCSALGFILIVPLSHGVTAGYADAYSAYSAMSSWTDNLLGFFENWLSLLGVSVASGDPLVSLASIVNMIRIFGGIILLVAPVVLACRFNKIKSPAVRAVLVGHFAVSAFILFAVTFGKLGGANWRLVPMLGTSVIASFMTAIELIDAKKLAARVGALLLAFLILMGCVTAVEISRMPADYGEGNSWHAVADELTARGLKYGYANFWWAESVTMISDGKLVVANLYAGTRTPTKYNYQQPADSYDDRPDADGYFLLLTESENDSMAQWLDVQRAQGKIREEFTVGGEPYNLRGYVGSSMYVYVFCENIF